jgi:hypothetical protein
MEQARSGPLPVSDSGIPSQVDGDDWWVGRRLAVRQAEADPFGNAEQTAPKMSADGSKWLNDARSRVVAAVISAFAVVMVSSISFYAGVRTGSPPVPRRPTPAISMTMPGPDSRINHSETVSGTAHNLRPHQMVWIFNESLLPDGTPSGRIYPELGPCPIQANGIWTCTGVLVGKSDNYGRQYLIWAAIVTDQQAYKYIKLAVAPSGSNGFSPAGGNGPPHVIGAPGVTDRQVTRCTLDETCVTG